VLGGGGESYTLEQIDQAARERKTPSLRCHAWFAPVGVRR